MKIKELNLKRFSEELENQAIDGGIKSLNEYQKNKMLINILTKRNKVLEPEVFTFVNAAPNHRRDGSFGLTEVREGYEVTKTSAKKAEEYFTTHNLPLEEIQETTQVGSHLHSNLTMKVEE